MLKKVIILAGFGALIGLSSVAANSATITVTRESCNRVVAYQPSPDVAYQPGVDVNGNEVASANYDNGPQIVVPKEIVIPIEVDLQQRAGRSTTDRKYDSNAQIGVVSYRDGKVFYNGKPLQGENQTKVAAACKRLLNRMN
jgi:hypothetical protein